MANLKKALLLGVLGATAATSLAGFFLLGTGGARLAVDGLSAVVQAIVIFAMLSPTEKRVDAMVDALRALARGERHQRVNPDEFAGLAEVARATNEVAASLTENDDPNLGPVKSQPRNKKLESSAEAAKPKRMEPRPAALGGDPRAVDTPAHDPNVGEVRKLKRPASDSGPVEAGSGRPSEKAPNNDTSIDEGPRSASSGEVEDSEPPSLPTRAELEALFAEFVAAKKSHDESVADLDLDAFVQTIMGECERLVAAHKCKGVKFEITMQDGEVSLRPRLLR
jgi:hypothetical protein